MKIRMITALDGSVSDFYALCTVEECGNELIVRYPIEKDSGAIYVKADELYMERKGEIVLGATFRAGETTSFYTEVMGHGGSIPVKTDRYTFLREKNGFSAELNYSLLFPAEVQQFSLKITVSEES